MTRLGYQIPNFTYPDTTPRQLFGSVVLQAKAAEEAGFDRVMLMDHFYQLPTLGAPEEPMFECYATLAALAQHTASVRLSALVTGNTYRNPALLAKQVTTLDHISHGRAALAIGAAWFELEHTSLGFEFGTLADRFEKLEEALRIVIPMLRSERVTFAGRHYRVDNAINSPPPLSRIPVMIGGRGERKTLRMVAQYADESNIGGPVSEVPHKLDVLAEHCERAGRDRSEIAVSKHITCCIAPTREEAERDLVRMAEIKGWNEARVEIAKTTLVFGDPDSVGEQLTSVRAAGVDGFTINLAVNGYQTERIALLGEVANKVLG
jgi:F420-dependent oxidoreductase-like protein